VVSGSGGLIKNGAYNLILAVTNTYSGNTTVNAGRLTLTNNGAIPSCFSINVGSGAMLDAIGRSDSTFTLASGQTLAGRGTIRGNLIVGAGGTLAPGPSLVTLTVTNGAVTLQPLSTTIMDINRASSATSDLIRGDTNITYGGTLNLSNLGPALLVGDSFKLFTATNYLGSFSTILPPQPGQGLRWDTGQLNSAGITDGGTLKVALLPQPVVTNASLSGGNINIGGANGTAGYFYRVLGSTNVAGPLASWTILRTNVFDGSGNFQFTSGTTNLQQFFRIQAL
jgi:autotransporter-associated beta strand protein